MLLSISDFFKCPDVLDKLHNCGFLSSYLDPFARWMAKQQFADFTIRSHITNVAHLSQSLDEIELDIRDLNDHIQTFLFKHTPLLLLSRFQTAIQNPGPYPRTVPYPVLLEIAILRCTLYLRIPLTGAPLYLLFFDIIGYFSVFILTICFNITPII